MMNDCSEKDGVSRRKALKQIGVATSASALTLNGASLASAASGDYLQGESVFVETKLEYANVKSNIHTVNTSLLSYIVDESRDRVMLNDSSLETANNDLILTNGNNFTNVAIPAIKTDFEIPVNTDYRRHERRAVPLNKPITVPTITASLNDDSISIRIQGHEKSVTPGTEAYLNLSQNSVRVETTELKRNEKGEEYSHVVTNTQLVTPRLSVKNHGTMSIYAGKDVRLLPMKVDDTYTQARARSHLNVAPSKIVKKTDTDLLIIDDPERVTTDEKQKLAAMGGDEN